MRFNEYLQALRDGQSVGPDDTTIPRQAERFQGRPAGLLTRILGSAIDTVVVYLLVTGLDLSLRALDLVATPFFNLPAPTPPVLLGLGFVIFWGYSTWAWSSLGRTLGDHVMGIRVMTSQGAGLGAGRAALRALAVLAFPPGVLSIPFSTQGRSLQDMLVGTRVHYDWVTRVPPSIAVEPALESPRRESRRPD